MTHCLRERTQCNGGKNEKKKKQKNRHTIILKKQRNTHHPEKIKFKLTANKDGHSDGPSKQGDSKKPAASSPEVFQLSMMDFRFSSFFVKNSGSVNSRFRFRFVHILHFSRPAAPVFLRGLVYVHLLSAQTLLMLVHLRSEYQTSCNTIFWGTFTL